MLASSMANAVVASQGKHAVCLPAKNTIDTQRETSADRGFL